MNIISTLKSGLQVIEVIQAGTIRKLWYGFLFAFCSNYGRIFTVSDISQMAKDMWIRGQRVTNLRFADDIDLLAESKDQLQELTETVNESKDSD